MEVLDHRYSTTGVELFFLEDGATLESEGIACAQDLRYQLTVTEHT